MTRSTLIKLATIGVALIVSGCASSSGFTLNRIDFQSTYYHPQLAFVNANKEMRVEFYNIPDNIDQQNFMKVVTGEMRRGKEIIDIDFTPAPAPNAPGQTRVLIAANIAKNVHVQGSCKDPERLNNPLSGPVNDLLFVFCYEEKYRSSLRLEAPPIEAFESSGYRQAIRLATRELLPLVPRDGRKGDRCKSAGCQ